MKLLAGLMIAAASPLAGQRPVMPWPPGFTPTAPTPPVVPESLGVNVVTCSARDCISARHYRSDYADMIRAAKTRETDSTARLTEIILGFPSSDTAWVQFRTETLTEDRGKIFTRTIRVERRKGVWVAVRDELPGGPR